MVGTALGGESGEDCIVAALVNVSNTGAPSALDVIDVKLKANGKEASGIPIPIQKDGVTVVTRSGAQIHYDKSELLPVKLSTPIPTGGEVIGLVMVIVRGITYLDAHASGTTVTVTLRDVYGGEHVFHTTLDESHMRFPDMKNLQPKTMPLQP